jgi:hypothetical protein
MEQKAILYENDNSLRILHWQMEKEALEGWFVHEVVTQEHTQGSDYIVVYRKN